MRETKNAHKKWLSELVSKYDLAEIPNKIHLLKGYPADVISAVAKKSRAELVVMGTVARTGIRGFLIGNTAERTLNELDCSVLTLKPTQYNPGSRRQERLLIRKKIGLVEVQPRLVGRANFRRVHTGDAGNTFAMAMAMACRICPATVGSSETLISVTPTPPFLGDARQFWTKLSDILPN